MEEIEKLKEFLEKRKKDLLETKKEGGLSREGIGMFTFINSIYQYMGWEINENYE